MNHTPLTAGKIRRLQAASAAPGRIAGSGHRSSPRVGADDGPATGAATLRPKKSNEFKLDVVRQIGSLATAVILDPAVRCSASDRDVQALARECRSAHVSLTGEIWQRQTSLRDGPSAGLERGTGRERSGPAA